VLVYDIGSIGHGASGAAAGILHPFSPKGKLTWCGLEGFAAATRLLSISEDALGESCNADTASSEQAAVVAVQNGVLRLGGHARESWDLDMNLQQLQHTTGASSSSPHLIKCSHDVHFT
jgi:hypothetical protein